MAQPNLLPEVEVIGIRQLDVDSVATSVTKCIGPDTYTNLDMIHADVSEVLRFNSSTYIRSYGPGLASTFTVQGFSPAQSNVYWSGVPLNSPALGLTDLSTIPMGAGLTLDRGNSGAQFGSGYMGGALHLWDGRYHNQFIAELGYTFETTNLSRINALVGLGTDSASHSVELTSTRGNLDFTYEDLNDVSRQRIGADQEQYHLKYTGYQGLGSHSLSWGAWGSYLDRGIPRSISERYEEGARQFDDVARGYVRHNWSKNKLQWTTQFSGTYEDQQYVSDVISDTNIAVGLYGQTELSLLSIPNTRIAVTLDYAYQYVEGSSKSPQGINRIGTSLSAVHNLTRDLKLSTGGRIENQTVWTPFIPFASIEWEVNNWYIHVLSRAHYRFPTLNDLFWEPGGNPDLRPELGQRYNLAFGKKVRSSHLGIWRFQVSSFWASVTDYILWVPAGTYFEPRNVRKVHTRGLTAEITHLQTIGQFYLEETASYSWTKTTVVESVNPSDPSVGNQLIYTPQHRASLRMKLYAKQSKWQLSINSDFTGRVHTTTDNQPILALDPFVVLDIRAGYTFELNKSTVLVTAGIKNALNTEYYLQRFYPMPGIQGVFSITYQFNHEI